MVLNHTSLVRVCNGKTLRSEYSFYSIGAGQSRCSVRFYEMAGLAVACAVDAIRLTVRHDISKKIRRQEKNALTQIFFQ